MVQSIHLDSKSKYAILPCTFDPNKETSFTISVFTENDVKLRPLRDSREVILSVCLFISLLSLNSSLFSHLCLIDCDQNIIKTSSNREDGKGQMPVDVWIIQRGETILNTFCRWNRRQRSRLHSIKRNLSIKLVSTFSMDSTIAPSSAILPTSLPKPILWLRDLVLSLS